MKKILYITFCLFLFGNVSCVFAQEVKTDKVELVDDEDVVDDEEAIEDDEDIIIADDEESDEAEEVSNEDSDMTEGMLQNIDELLKEYHVRNNLQENGDCYMTDVNPEFTEDVYIDRLQRMPTAIEMPYNEVVRKFIDRYSGRLRRSVSIMLGAQNFYMPFFEQALESYQLPLELKYLPVIESALNPKAVSRVGATGLWQFMLATGKQYGLKVNSLVDERCDPERASYAAAHYLRDLYRIFGDWHLVIAAYNAGPENINKAIRRAGGVKDYWKIYPYLPAETRGYVPAFIAANYILNYHCEHNICPMITTLPAKTDTIMINKDVHLRQIAEVIKIDIDQLRAINPQYRRDVINGSAGKTALRLPVEYVNSFIDSEDSIYTYKADELLKRSVVAVNDITPTYSRQTSSRYSRSKVSRNRRSRSRSVSVRKGDTLSEIARRNHTTVAKLRRLNNISGSNIRAGKKLRVK